MEGSSILRIVERSTGVSQAIPMGKVSMTWFAGTVESLLKGAGWQEFM